MIANKLFWRDVKKIGGEIIEMKNLESPDIILTTAMYERGKFMIVANSSDIYLRYENNRVKCDSVIKAKELAESICQK